MRATLPLVCPEALRCHLLALRLIGECLFCTKLWSDLWAVELGMFFLATAELTVINLRHPPQPQTFTYWESVLWSEPLYQSAVKFITGVSWPSTSLKRPVPFMLGARHSYVHCIEKRGHYHIRCGKGVNSRSWTYEAHSTLCVCTPSQSGNSVPRPLYAQEFTPFAIQSVHLTWAGLYVQPYSLWEVNRWMMVTSCTFVKC